MVSQQAAGTRGSAWRERVVARSLRGAAALKGAAGVAHHLTTLPSTSMQTLHTVWHGAVQVDRLNSLRVRLEHSKAGC